jgi:hypothetical protein
VCNNETITCSTTSHTNKGIRVCAKWPKLRELCYYQGTVIDYKRLRGGGYLIDILYDDGEFATVDLCKVGVF